MGHDGLIYKLEKNVLFGSFFQNYLNNWKQRVVLNGSYHNSSTVESGVPQGSVLGPLLFFIYINDLEINIKSNLCQGSCNICKRDHDIIHHQWSDPTKQTTEVLFSCKRFSPNHPQLIFNGTAVEKVNEHKHIGLVLDSKISFEKHLMVKKTCHQNLIKHFFFNLV